VTVRITWITAILVSVLAILSGLLSGTDGRDSSRQLPGFAFADGGDSSLQLPEFALFDPVAPVASAGKTKTAAPQGDRRQWAKEQAPGDNHSSSGVSDRSGSQPKDAAGRAPVVTPRPKPQPASSETQARLPQASSVTLPKPPQAPSVAPPAPSVTPQAPSVTPQAPSVALPKPPQAPSVTLASSQPPASVSASAPVQATVTVANNSVGLP
jgi:hypothetical protein